MNHEDHSVEVKGCEGNNCLWFSFTGMLKEKDASQAIKKWRDHFDTHHPKKITLVWDTLQMKGYDPVARHLWQYELKAKKEQIQNIWLISDSKMIKAGAMILSLFSSFPIRVVEDKSEITYTH